jgi:hypothetical protein
MILPEPLPPLQLHDFVESYRQVAKQLKINIARHPMLVDQKYVALHVRAGDKSAPPKHFNTFDSEEDVYVFMDMMRCEWDAFLTA